MSDGFEMQSALSDKLCTRLGLVTSEMNTMRDRVALLMLFNAIMDRVEQVEAACLVRGWELPLAGQRLYGSPQGPDLQRNWLRDGHGPFAPVTDHPLAAAEPHG